ncbi:MAG: sugar-transfer associated ATP-grasp domain-containing protein [Bacilli bacterium]|jgi:hypothetical protein
MKLFEIRNYLSKIELKRVFSYLQKNSKIDSDCLSKEEKKQSKEYWKQFGVTLNKNDYSYISSYKFFCGGYLPSFFPNYFLYTYIKTFLNNQSYANAIDNKALYLGLLPDLIHPATLLFRIDGGLLLDKAYNEISFEEFVGSLDKTKKYIFKPGKDTCGSKGIIVFNRNNIDIIKAALSQYSDFVVQEVIVSNKAFALFGSKALPTIRIYSLYYGEKPQILAACLRIESSDSEHITLGGEVYIPINEDGTLRSRGFNNNTPNISDFDQINGLSFAGFEIPLFSKICAQVLKSHLRFKSIRYIAWDFAITHDEEPVFIEFNLAQSGPGILQVAAYPNKPFGNYTEEIFLKSFKIK